MLNPPVSDRVGSAPIPNVTCRPALCNIGRGRGIPGYCPDKGQLRPPIWLPLSTQSQIRHCPTLPLLRSLFATRPRVPIGHHHGVDRTRTPSPTLTSHCAPPKCEHIKGQPMQLVHPVATISFHR
jgi:hypothetical protein